MFGASSTVPPATCNLLAKYRRVAHQIGRHVPDRRARAAPTRTARTALVAAINSTRVAENQLFESVALWRYRSLARADMTHRCSTPRSLVEEFRSCRANIRPNRKSAFTTVPSGHDAQKIRPRLTRCSPLNQIRIVPMQLTRFRIPRLPEISGRSKPAIRLA